MNCEYNYRNSVTEQLIFCGTHISCTVFGHNNGSCKVLCIGWNNMVLRHSMPKYNCPCCVFSRSGGVPQSHTRAVHSTCVAEIKVQSCHAPCRMTSPGSQKGSENPDDNYLVLVLGYRSGAP